MNNEQSVMAASEATKNNRIVASTTEAEIFPFTGEDGKQYYVCPRSGKTRPLFLSEVVFTPEWQPIETAPKDGSAVLLCDGCAMMVASWGHDSLFNHEPKKWVYGECEGNYNWRQSFESPTHWMPLPEPPAP